MHCDLDNSVPDWIIDHPETAAVFDQWRIDTSCGGKSLEYLCHQAGLDPHMVLDRLRQAILAPAHSDDQRLKNNTNTSLETSCD
jgi:iron-sulfur cluster repair protein YtfE (RIC family)